MTTPTTQNGAVLHEGRELTPADARREAEALDRRAEEMKVTAGWLRTAARQADLEETTALLEPVLLAHLDDLEAKGARVSRVLTLDVSRVATVAQFSTGELGEVGVRRQNGEVVHYTKWVSLPVALSKLQELRLRVARGHVAHVVRQGEGRWTCVRCGAWVDPQTSTPARPDLRLCGTPRPRQRTPSTPAPVPLFTEPPDA